MIKTNIAEPKNSQLLQESLNQLTAEERQHLSTALQGNEIVALVDGRGLACPMPLLKTKVALRSMQPNDSVYILATDPNSQIDLAAFSKQTGLQIELSTQTSANDSANLEKLDTIFHVIITKTHGN